MQKLFALIAKIKPAHFSNEVQGKFVDSLRQCVRVHRARSRADPCGGELKICHVVVFRVGSVKKSQTLCVFASKNQSIPVCPAGADTVQRCVTSPNLQRRQKRGWTADVWLNRLVCMSQYCNIEFQLKSYCFHKQVAEMQEEPITNTVNTYCSLQQRGQQVWRICCARA